MTDYAPPTEGVTTPPAREPDVVSEYESLVRTFDLLRERHQVDVMQPGLLACVCGERLPIVYSDEGQPLYNPIIRHHHEHYASAATKRVAEFQWNALEMARKAGLAERRAGDAEAEVERLRDVLAEVRRVFDLQCPPVLPDAYVDRGAWMAHSWWNTVLGHVLKRASLTGGEGGTDAGEGATRQDTGTAWVTRSADCPEAPAQAHLPTCAHEWLDRPESDTRECLICGTEATG